MDLNTILHLLRNPWGHSHDMQRDARLAAATLLEDQARIKEVARELGEAPEVRAFQEWLNDNRDANVGAVFHDVVAKVTEAVAYGRLGWREAAVAWSVLKSIHRDYCEGKDPFFTTRQKDFNKHWEDASMRAQGNLAAPPVVPIIHAEFYTEVPGGGAGTTEAPVLEVRGNDDGSFTVRIDHWPLPASAAAMPGYPCGRPGTGECACAKFFADPTNCERRLEAIKNNG